MGDHKKDCKKCRKKDHHKKDHHKKCCASNTQCDRRCDFSEYQFEDTPPPDLSADPYLISLFIGNDDTTGVIAPGEAIPFERRVPPQNFIVIPLGNGVFLFPRGGLFKINAIIPVEIPGGTARYSVNGNDLKYTSTVSLGGQIIMSRYVPIPDGGKFSVVNPPSSNSDIVLTSTSPTGVPIRSDLEIRFVVSWEKYLEKIKDIN